MDKFRDVFVMAQHFGIHQHPIWQQLLLHRDSGACSRDVRHKFMALVNSVRYGRDPETQYMQLTAAKVSRRLIRQRQKTYWHRWEKQFGFVVAPAGIMKQAALDHLRRRFRTGQLYSIPLIKARISSLADVTGAPAKRPRLQVSGPVRLARDDSDLLTIDEQHGRHDEPEPGPEEEQQAQQQPESNEVHSWVRGQLFFRVIHSQLYRAKVQGLWMGHDAMMGHVWHGQGVEQLKHKC